MERLSRDRLLMDVALLVKRRSTCLRRQVGAVLSREGRILSTGYGGAPAGVPHCTPETCNAEKPCIRTIHAEANVIAFAAKYGVSTESTTLYCTASPCIECAKLIINAGIVRVVYDEEYRDTGPIVLLRSVGITVEKHGAGTFTPTWTDACGAEGGFRSSSPMVPPVSEAGRLHADSTGHQDGKPQSHGRVPREDSDFHDDP